MPQLFPALVANVQIPKCGTAIQQNQGLMNWFIVCTMDVPLIHGTAIQRCCPLFHRLNLVHNGCPMEAQGLNSLSWKPKEGGSGSGSSHAQMRQDQKSCGNARLRKHRFVRGPLGLSVSSPRWTKKMSCMKKTLGKLGCL